MIKLTTRQEQFAQSVASGKTQADAYRSAYKCENWKNDAIWSQASRLMKNSKVSARIDELRAELSAKLLWSREDSVRELRKVIDGPDKASDIVQAVKELNAMHGFNAPQKIEHAGDGGGPIKFTRVELVPFSHDASD